MSDTPPESTETTETADNELLKLQAERDELFQKLARVQADFQNSRKRLEADMEMRMQYANSGLIKSLLPVIDNFERALAVDAGKTDSATMQKGLQLVHDQWITVLKSQLVQEIAPQQGDAFDPNLHQALMQVDDHRFTDKPTVILLMQKGYSLNDRVLRPAQVSVSKTG